jgi:antibiotic biosynthesis monooxygenase (ABM) superfamily enzyme
MIRYEVNLELDPEIKEEYLAWLKPHIDQMLTFKGFENAILFENTEKANCFSVQYDVATMDDMNDYLTNHAAEMRNDAISKFADKFKASRRIMNTSGN